MLPEFLAIYAKSNLTNSKSTHQRMVEDFMHRAGQEVPASPVIPCEAVRRLRAKIILDETLETIHGLGFDVVVTGGHRILAEGHFELSSAGHIPPNLVEIVDGCADIRVVTTGTLSACGVPDEVLTFEVDQNNLAKFGPGGYRREDGKWVKPPNHQPPRVKEIIEHYRT
jgi:predicted HAD superfamily Cof-like phosphohydrolase